MACNNCRSSFTCARCLREGTPGQITIDQALREKRQEDDERDCDPGDCSDHAVPTR